MLLSIPLALGLALVSADDAPTPITTLPRVEVVATAPGYSGRWQLDADANARLQRDAQTRMRKRMAKLGPRPTAKDMPDRPPGGMGGGMPPGGMGGGGMPGGGMPGGGMPPGGPPGGAMPDPLSMMSSVGLMRPEMDFALPLEGDLEIAYDAQAVRLGREGRTPVTLRFGKGAVALGEGDATRAFASRESGPLVIEINTDDGVQVTHTYLLEAQGQRLRVKTHVLSRTIPLPGGVETERIYRRAAETSDAAAH